MACNYEITSQIESITQTFTLPENAYSICNVNIGGSEYFDFTHVSGSDTFTTDDLFAAGLLGFVDYSPSPTVGATGFLTVGEIKDEFKVRKDDVFPDIGNPLYLYWINAINNLMYPIMYNQEPNSYIVESDITTADGTSLYTIPTDIKTTAMLGCGVFPVDSDGKVADKTMIMMPINSYIKGWDIYGGELSITPTPSSVDSYKFRYIPSIVKLSSDLNATVIPVEYSELFFNAIDSHFEQFDENEFRESLSDQRFIRSLDQLVETVSLTPKVFIY